jgi:protoheme IX farnesyltransferase
VAEFAGRQLSPGLQGAPAAPASWRDYLALTKPLIVALLLATTFAGMAVGGRRLPEASLATWTLIGGALVAGGASAWNQVIDRELDARMTRTRRRPLPAGRVSPGGALGFALSLCALGLGILAWRVNALSALLAAAGLVYYVGVYTLLLKRMTPQNIVIGGGAGAIPPLVGWAAATGELTMPALFLFAIVFFWTPPHFWALALTRSEEYRQAGVPMLPVVAGEGEAQRQILLYSIQLVALTLLLPGIGLVGALFLVVALGLGALFITQALNLKRRGGKRRAWALYRYSSLYLALIFAAMVVDVVAVVPFSG